LEMETKPQSRVYSWQSLYVTELIRQSNRFL
jgi:hypothetical protein